MNLQTAPNHFTQTEPFDRAHMAGPFYRDECKMLWRTLASNSYICDERYNPGRKLQSDSLQVNLMI